MSLYKLKVWRPAVLLNSIRPLGKERWLAPVWHAGPFDPSPVAALISGRGRELLVTESTGRALKGARTGDADEGGPIQKRLMLMTG